MNLHRFDETGESAPIADNSVAESVGTTATETVGDTTSSTGDSSTERLSYEKIREMYKDDFNAEMKSTIEKRLKKSKQAEEGWKKVQPLLERNFRKFGIEDGNIDTLMQKVDADDSYYEDLALQNGTTADIERQLEKSAREAKEAREALAEREEADRQREAFTKIRAQVEEVKASFPEFDLATEMNNPTFASLASNPNLKLIDCYRATHFDDITSRAMQVTAQNVQQKVVNSIKSNAPQENGIGNTTPAQISQDPSKLSLQEINEMIARAKRGERITFK